MIRENVPLAPFTTFGIGGPARWYMEADSSDQVRAALAAARERNVPLFVLGGGSNLLVSDAGYPGLVLRVTLKGMNPAGSVDPCLRFHGARAHQVRFIETGAGEGWDEFVAWAVSHDFGGLECLSGIPGTVGGTPIQNVGAYGQEVGPVICQVRALDRTRDEIVQLAGAECGFRYRESRFNTTERDRWIVLSVTYALPLDEPPCLGYRDLADYFAGSATPPTRADVRHAVLDIRHRKGMILVGDDPDCRSAGSFFKNPVVPGADYDRLAGLAGGALPRFPAADGFVKVPAARLIEAAGFARGHRRGGAAISSKHTLALTNHDGATAADVVDLAREIRDGVAARFGVRLQPEPILLGFDSPPFE